MKPNPTASPFADMIVTPPLKNILKSAYQCSAISTTCSCVRYAPQNGLLPRGYTGAFGHVSDVKLVICLAEPGEPDPDEFYDVKLTPEKLIDDIAKRVAQAYSENCSPFHRNVRRVLDYCWPQLSFDDQLKFTWITEATLCSAQKTTGPVPRRVENECAVRYLKPQLALFSHAFVIALGKKAERRLELIDRKPDVVARAAGRPTGDFETADASWKNAGIQFRDFIKTDS